MHRALQRAALGAALLVSSIVAVPGLADASTSTTGTVKCTVTARHPRLDLATMMVRGSAAVTCNVATVVGVETAVVEMDLTVESAIVVPYQTRWVSVGANVVTVVTTSRALCVNTEPGNEEYATKARALVSGTVSAWDRTVPDPDSYAC